MAASDAQPRDRAESPLLQRGAPIGRYLVIELVGRGAMGDVYAAYDPELDRKVAVKLLQIPDGGKGDIGEQKARLLREAQAIARLSHPNVVVVHDVGSFGERVFIAMEFVDGHTLTYWLHAAPRRWRETVDVFVSAGRGLAAAHHAELVHRDFKGENVMITGTGHVRVMDFGLARQAPNRKAGNSVPSLATLAQADTNATIQVARQRACVVGDRLEGSPLPMAPRGTGSFEAAVTETGLIVGTPAYMAPEQFRGQIADAQSDQFSFCVALYEALYGQRPFAGATMSELADNVIHGRVRPTPADRRVPSWVRRALLRGLSVDSSARWPSMDELLAALAHNPNARGWWYALGGVVVASATAAALAVGMAPAKPSICQVSADRFAGIWERAGDRHTMRRSAIAASMAAAEAPRARDSYDKLSRLLDDYVGRWSRMYTDACEATNVRGEQSHEVLDLKMSCLRTRLSELRAFSDVLVEGDAVAARNAIGAAAALTPVEICGEINSVVGSTIAPPTDAAMRQRVDALRGRLVAIKALQDAGRYAQALEQVTAVVADPRTSEYDPVMAEALNRMALLLVDTGRNRDAHAPIEEALWLAEGSRHDVLVIELATVEIYLSGYLEHDMVRAQHWANQARVFLKRVGGHDLLRAWMLNNIGVALDANGDKVAAAEELEESLRIKERILGKDHPDVAFSLANLADTLNSIGRSKEALELSNRGVEILSRTFGASHPRLIAQLANRAEILNRLGRYEEARHDAERAVAVQRTEAGPELNLIYALAPLGEAELGLGHSTRAIAPLRQALHLAEEQAVTEELPRLRFALARSLWDSGRDRKQARLLAAAAAAPVASTPVADKATVLADKLRGPTQAAAAPAPSAAPAAAAPAPSVQVQAAAWLSQHGAPPAPAAE
jgi:serine/threonine protein kinase